MAATRKLLTYDFSFAGIPYWSGGDTDVYTKKGRQTKVEIFAGNLRIGEDKRSVVVNVSVDIQEVAKNYTRLKRVEDIVIPVPVDWNCETMKFVDVKDFRYLHTYEGENQNWNTVPITDPFFCVSACSIKFDERQDDDHKVPDPEATGMKMTLRIPVLVEDLTSAESTYTRVVEIMCKPGKARELCGTINDEVLPILRKQAGFVDETVLVSDTDPNRVLALSSWKTREDAQRYEREQFKTVQKIMQHLLDAEPTVRTFDVHAPTARKVAVKQAA